MSVFTSIQDDDLVRSIAKATTRLDYMAPGVSQVVAGAIEKQFQGQRLKQIAIVIDGDEECCRLEYEPDPDLRDTEQVPLLEDGGIAAFIEREVLPYTPDAWVKQDATKVGYEVSFTRHFYKPQPLRTLDEIAADILAIEKLAIEKEADGLLTGIIKGAA